MHTPTILLLLLLALGAVAGAMVFGVRRWAIRTLEMRAQLRSGLEPVRSPTVNFSDLDSLPGPVRRYLKNALTDRQAIITEARIRHSGTFNMGQSSDKWKSFASDQLVITRRPGFDWHGRIGPVRIHDAYIAGEGILHAALHGVLTLVKAQDTRDLAQGELMRFLAETVWFPTVLAPRDGVRWKAVDDRSAEATISDGSNEARLLFAFDQDNLVESVSAKARGRMVRGKFEPTPWRGRFWNYTERGGMKIPLEGEVAWMLPEGPKPYWRGTITDIEYVFAEA